MWALLCDDSSFGGKHDPLICGVFASKKEALEVANDAAVGECLVDHYIAKVKVAISYDKQRKIKGGAPSRAPKKSRQDGRKRP